jgi:hypothetical protein
MKTITLKTMTCYATEDWVGDDECRLKIYTDGSHAETLERDMSEGDTWSINKSYQFNNTVEFKLYDEDWPDPDDHLGTQTVTGVTQSIGNATVSFTNDDADYDLSFSASVPGAAIGGIDDISFRKFFARLAPGVMRDNRHRNVVRKNLIYRQDEEIISFRETKTHHALQDDTKSSTVSVRRWIETHCDYFSHDTIITDKADYRNAASVVIYGNWESVKDHKTRVMSGFGDLSRVTNTDNPVSHETRDWNMNIVPDPTYMYMLGTGMKGEGSGLDLVPIMHNEWETGSFPSQWRPFWGEYVQLWGRHIWDVGHVPVAAEIHPPHAVVRQHTTAAPLGNSNAMVPANRAVIGMGLSGGFPGHSDSRWNAEFNGLPGPVWGDTTDSWPTNLKKHPLTFRIYPPVSRPSANAQLRTRIVLARYIRVNNWSEGDDFLELTQYDDPAFGGVDKGFRDFQDAHGYPAENATGPLRPQFTLGTDASGEPAFYDVGIDLSSLSGIPVGYYAILECGWSEKGSHTLQRYRATFQTIKAIETDEWWDDWHLHYGINGQWAWWWTDDFIEEGDTYTKNRAFTVWTVDDLPLVFRDCGVEWDGTDFGNERLDQIALVVTPKANTGFSHLMRIAELSSSNSNLSIVSPAVETVDQGTSSIRFRLTGSGGDTRHRWTIKLDRQQVI